MIQLENNTWYKLMNGSSIFVACYKDKDDAIIFHPKNGKSRVQVFSPNIESGADLGIYFEDNLYLDMWGSCKDNPKFLLKDGEYPSILRFDLSEKSMKVLPKLQKNEDVKNDIR